MSYYGSSEIFKCLEIGGLSKSSDSGDLRLLQLTIGVPLFQGRTTLKHFEKMKKKVRARIDRWSNKVLSVEGKMVLINSVLCSIPLYTFATYAAPKKVIRELEGSFSTFL